MIDQSLKWLIVTEKPSVAVDLAKVLGGCEKKSDHYESETYYITWAVGHLVEFLEPEDIDPKYKRWLLQDLPVIPEQFKYKPKKGQTERLNHIKALAKKNFIKGFINACDAGREGELIFREIYDYCEQSKPFKRLWLQSMTPDAIRQGFIHLKEGSEYNPLADAARCRAESDWLIGMNATRAVTKRLKTRATKGVWSVGRVQTPTLALIVKRELDFLKHRPESYFTLEGRFSVPTHEYLGVWFDPHFKKPAVINEEDSSAVREREDRIFSQNKLQEILKDFEKNKNKASAKETRKESRENAPQLFDLTLLQREANRKFGLSASRTLQAAQRLYEKHKLLTYPRTDSRCLPEDYVDHVKNVLREFAASHIEYAKHCQKVLKTGLLNKDKVFNNKLISDHFAIIPTGQVPSVKLDGDDARIFDLVFKRFIAAFMTHALWAKVERLTTVGSQLFRTRVQDLQEPGWREVYGLDSEEESRLPKLNEKNNDTETLVKVEELTTQNNATKPPPRYSESRLLSLMEHCGRSVSDEDIAEALKDKGIGTPATRAEVIENLIIKEYIQRIGKGLKATAKGIRLIDILMRIPIDSLSKVELTGEMEYDLKLVEKGKKDRSAFMNNMENFTTHIVEYVRSFNYDDLYKNDLSLGSCPICKKGQIQEGFWGYKCSQNKFKANEKQDTSENCSFIIWKEKNLRYVDRSLVEDVLNKKVSGPFEFSNPAGSSLYEEYLTISHEKGIIFCDEFGVIKESSSAADAEILHEELLNNTFLNKVGHIKVTKLAYMCEFGEPKPDLITKENLEIKAKKTKKKTTKPKKEKILRSRMPRILCTREMSLEDYKAFLITGATPPISDFKSKKGRPFAASLHLKENGNFEFKFVSRKALIGETETTPKEKKPRKVTRKPKVIKKDL